MNLVICYIAIEHGHFYPFLNSGLPIKMVIFHTYVGLPEGMLPEYVWTTYMHELVGQNIICVHTRGCHGRIYELYLAMLPFGLGVCFYYSIWGFLK